MPACTQCQTSDTPCWREGPEGARTLCNACGIRWKRLMGRTKRPAKRITGHRQRRNSSVAPKDRKNTPAGQLNRVARAHRPMRSISLPMADTSALTTRKIMQMGQNELLDSILTRLEDLESSQTRASLQVRVLANRLKPDFNPSGGVNEAEELSLSGGESLREQYDEDLEQELDAMMHGDGEDEAWLLDKMRTGTPVTLLSYEELKIGSI